MAERLKPGDVVSLKSGSPPMTVVSIDGSRVRCQWFVGTKLEAGFFEAVTLETTEPEVIEPDDC